jgi:hypothetical protein
MSKEERNISAAYGQYPWILMIILVEHWQELIGRKVPKRK